MATNGEDRPIVVVGGNEMYTISLPPATDQGGGSFTVKALPEAGPFQTIEFSNTETNAVMFRHPAVGNWTITIK
jgi:hypothetical protein